MMQYSDNMCNGNDACAYANVSCAASSCGEKKILTLGIAAAMLIFVAAKRLWNEVAVIHIAARPHMGMAL